MTEATIVEQAPRMISPYSPQERTWAALAHLSTVITVLLAMATAGLGGLITIFIPLAIYFAFREKSEYVAFHAMQAFALQLVASVGLFLFAVIGFIALILIWVISVLLIFILIGLVLIPISAVLSVAYLVILVFAPFVLAGFAVAGTFSTANGDRFRYPYLAPMVERWLHHAEGEPAAL